MMYLNLPNPGTTFPLVFNYEPETGTIAGRDADMVLIMIERSQGREYLPGNWPAIPILDPRNNAQDMAVLLAGWGYELPQELSELIPEQVDDSPPGSVS